MNVTEFLNALAEALTDPGDGLRYALADALMSADGVSVCTFAYAMLLTDNEGIVVRLPNGDEFQVSVVQSKFADA